MQVHCGNDDFADRDRLVAALSRERGKDMASDYARAVTPAIAHAGEEPHQRSLFANLRLQHASAPVPPPRLEDLIVRFAGASADIVAARKLGMQESGQQRAAFDAVRHALDAVQPDSAPTCALFSCATWE